MLAKREGSVYGRRRVWLTVSSIAILAAGAGNAGTCDGLPVPTPPIDAATAVLLAPAPRLPIGFFDFFGELKTPGEARQMVVDANLDPNVPDHYLRIGLIHITEALIEKGRQLFNTQVLGEFFTLNNILSLGPATGDAFGTDILELALTSFDPANDPDGSLSFLRDLLITTVLRPKSPTTNLKVGLSRDLRVGSTLFPAGTTINTGVDVAAGAFIPVGFEGGHVSCALCHTAVDPVSGREMVGAPNTDLWAALFIALTPNSAAVFLKLNKSDFDPMDPRFPKTGRRIIDSNGNTVQLPDPVVLETAVDDFLISVPPGSFDAGPDFSAAMTKMPDAWVFGEGGMGWDGGFNVGPFGGPTTFSNAVHSFELNLLSPANFSQASVGLDPEIYLGVILQNAPDPALRIPDGVRPSEWLAERFPAAERSVSLELPSYPNASLFSLNGLVFSPAGERFMESIIALGAFQASLTVPPNRTDANRRAIASGAVIRGAEVFAAASCTDCHPPPFFTNRRIISNDVIGANSARAVNRRVLEGNLVESVLPAFDLPVPLPPNPPLITLPPNEFASDNLTLPPGLDTPAGGLKVSGLLGTYLKAPYMHDAGVAVGAGALAIAEDGSYTIVDSGPIGVAGTTRISVPLSAAHSLRAMLDRTLRSIVTSRNLADPDLVRAHIDGTGHEFWVDPAAGFTGRQQSDLVDFLLSLDDNPGEF